MNTIYINSAVEGELDKIVISRIIEYTGGLKISRTFVLHSKNKLIKRLKNYNEAAKNTKTPWFVLVDLDQHECAPSMLKEILPNRSLYMCFRIAVRMVEAWLIADRQGIAEFLHISQNKVPKDPENLKDPKLALINLARMSRNKSIREDIVPKPDTKAKVGPLYIPRMQEFIDNTWNIQVAKSNAESLNRTLKCLHKLKTLKL